LLLDPLLLEHELDLSTSPHHQAVLITQPEPRFLLLTLKVNSCHHDLLSNSVPGLLSQHCSSSTGYRVRHHVPVLDDCITNHDIVLYLVLHPFHATSDRSNKHSLCNNDDHAAQRCQLQLLPDLQYCRQPGANCKFSFDSSFRGHLLIVVQGPFATKITSDYLLITQIACIPSAPSLIRRHAMPEATPEPTALYIRGAKPQTFTPIVKKNTFALPKPLEHLKRQVPTNTTGSPLVLAGEAFRLIQQLFTVLYSIGVINSGADLGEVCLQLQSANAILDLAQVGLNATQAATIVCPASLPDSDIDSFNQTLIATAAAGLYGVQLAANFTGTVDTTKLCTQLDLSPLPPLGVDVRAVQTFICNANNATSTASLTVSSPTNVPSIGTLTPFPLTNSSGGTYTWGGSITVTGPLGTAVTAPWGTGVPASGTGFFPTGNVTAVAGSEASGTAVSGSLPAGTGNLPASTGDVGTGTVINGTVVNGTVVDGVGFNGTVVNGTVTNGTAVNGTVVNGTVTNGTVTNGTGNLPSATGNTGPAISVNGTFNPSTGTGIAGSGTVASATSDASTGIPSSSAGSASSLGEYGQETSERVPHGPTSTPRYYPKYF
jgi:hypothetical protein